MRGRRRMDSVVSLVSGRARPRSSEGRRPAPPPHGSERSGAEGDGFRGPRWTGRGGIVNWPLGGQRAVGATRGYCRGGASSSRCQTDDGGSLASDGGARPLSAQPPARRATSRRSRASADCIVTVREMRRWAESERWASALDSGPSSSATPAACGSWVRIHPPISRRPENFIPGFPPLQGRGFETSAPRWRGRSTPSGLI